MNPTPAPVPCKPAASVSRANVDPATIAMARETLDSMGVGARIRATPAELDWLAGIMALSVATAQQRTCAVAERCPAVTYAIVALECADRQGVADGVRFAMAGGLGRVADELAAILVSDPHARAAVATARAEVAAALVENRAAAQ